MANKRINLAVFISGRGSNMQAIIAACDDLDFPAIVSVVVADSPDAKGLGIAKDHGIPTCVVPRKNHAKKADFEQAIYDALAPYSVDLICLAGFMQIMSADFIAHYNGRIINIHPSLLPAYKGLNTHARVLADGARETGCTVHYVTPGIDEGTIIAQTAVPVFDDDTETSLSARVLKQEHLLYPHAIKRIASDLT